MEQLGETVGRLEGEVEKWKGEVDRERGEKGRLGQ